MTNHKNKNALKKAAFWNYYSTQQSDIHINRLKSGNFLFSSRFDPTVISLFFINATNVIHFGIQPTSIFIMICINIDICILRYV